MSTIIDPTTGAPLVNPDVSLDTRPLDAQITPFKQLSVFPDLGRAPQYPDDAITVFSNTTAQKESNWGEPTIVTATDDRRLRVDTGESGGGGIPATAKYFTQSTHSGFGDLDYPLGSTITKLYSVVGHIHSWRDDFRNAQHLDMQLMWDGGLEQFQIYDVDVYYTSMTYPPNDALFPININFPGGYDLTTQFPYSGETHLLVNGGSTFWGAWNIQLVYE